MQTSTYHSVTVRYSNNHILMSSELTLTVSFWGCYWHIRQSGKRQDSIRKVLAQTAGNHFQFKHHSGHKRLVIQLNDKSNAPIVLTGFQFWMIYNCVKKWDVAKSVKVILFNTLLLYSSAFPHNCSDSFLNVSQHVLYYQLLHLVQLCSNVTSDLLLISFVNK